MTENIILWSGFLLWGVLFLAAATAAAFAVRTVAKYVWERARDVHYMRQGGWIAEMRQWLKDERQNGRADRWLVNEMEARLDRLYHRTPARHRGTFNRTD